MEIYFVLIGIFGTVFTSTFIVYRLIFGKQIKMNKRMSTVLGSDNQIPVRQRELSFPLFQRFIKPMFIGFTDFVAKFLPAVNEGILDKKLIEAGTPYNLSPKEFLVIKYLLTGGGIWLLRVLSQVTGKSNIQSIVLILTGGVFGWLIPDIILNSKIRVRKEQIEKQLPDVLDLLTVCIEAGLGFDGAMMKVVEKYKGVLADGFAQVLDETRMGKPRRQSLRDMADRLNVDDLSSFVGSVIMAEQLGIRIGNVMRMQAGGIRQKRRQKIEEMAMKAPVKMLIPMVMFIFPAIFVVLLGPAVIQIMRAFK